MPGEFCLEECFSETRGSLFCFSPVCQTVSQSLTEAGFSSPCFYAPFGIPLWKRVMEGTTFKKEKADLLQKFFLRLLVVVVNALTGRLKHLLKKL